jgi:hypothetical protein
MGGSSDLYKINLNPSDSDVYVPTPVVPNGSIGGSGVGANAQDDQRVRDLMEQHIPDVSTLIAAASVAGGGGGGALILGGWMNSNHHEYVNDVATGFIDIPSVNSVVVTLLGNPILIQFSCQVYLETIEGLATTDVLAQLTIDGQFVGFAERSEADVDVTTNVAASDRVWRFPLGFVVALMPGVAMSAQGTSAAAMTAVLKAGAHTFNIDYQLATNQPGGNSRKFSTEFETCIISDLGSTSPVKVT